MNTFLDHIHVATASLRTPSSVNKDYSADMVGIELGIFMRANNACIQSGIEIVVSDSRKVAASCNESAAITINSTFTATVVEDNDYTQWFQAFEEVVIFLLKEFNAENEAVVVLDDLGYLVTL
jgi:hypothetical protein